MSLVCIFFTESRLVFSFGGCYVKGLRRNNDYKSRKRQGARVWGERSGTAQHNYSRTNHEGFEAK